jgi:adenine phosphoribosyltransferase
MDPRIEQIRAVIREVPDFPKPGILFYDITTALADASAFKAITELLIERYRDQQIDHVVAIESRGFIFGAPLAYALGLPLNILRKPGKLPADVDEVSYDLEYGSATLQIHRGELRRGGKAVVIDDLLATGGTAAAAIELVQKQGAEVCELAFVIELDFLKGRDKLAPTPVHSLLRYAD